MNGYEILGDNPDELDEVFDKQGLDEIHREDFKAAMKKRGRFTTYPASVSAVSAPKEDEE